MGNPGFYTQHHKTKPKKENGGLAGLWEVHIEAIGKYGIKGKKSFFSRQRNRLSPKPIKLKQNKTSWTKLNIKKGMYKAVYVHMYVTKAVK